MSTLPAVRLCDQGARLRLDDLRASHLTIGSSAIRLGRKSRQLVDERVTVSVAVDGLAVRLGKLPRRDVTVPIEIDRGQDRVVLMCYRRQRHGGTHAAEVTAALAAAVPGANPDAAHSLDRPAMESKATRLLRRQRRAGHVAPDAASKHWRVSGG